MKPLFSALLLFLACLLGVVTYDAFSPNGVRAVERRDQAYCEEHEGVYVKPRFQPALCIAKSAVIWRAQ